MHFFKYKNELAYLKTTQGFDHTDAMVSENGEISFPNICVIFVVFHLKDMSFVWKWWGGLSVSSTVVSSYLYY